MKRAYAYICLLFLAGCVSRRMPEDIATFSEYQRVVPPKRQEMIVIDAGHGGRDLGAASKREDYEEKSLTLSTAFLVQEALRQKGYQTVLTRNHDTYIPLDTRADIANTLHANLFVSIHYNFSTSQEARGVEVFYYKETKTPHSARIASSKQLGQMILNHIIKSTGAASRGVKPANFAVVRETTMPAVLIEAGFLSNPQERQCIRDPAYLRCLARGISEGVEAYLCGSSN